MNHGLPGGMVQAGAPRNLQVTGVAGVPSSWVTVVVVNLTVTGPTAASHLTAWPAGSAEAWDVERELCSHQTVVNQAIVPVGADGRITLANAVGRDHVVVDVQGWFGPAG